MGMGTVEILVIALIAFILLGPERMIEAAKMAGKAVREVRRMTSEISELVLDEERTGSARAKPVNRGGGGSPGRPEEDAQASNSSAEESDPEDRPVAFRPAGDATEPRNAEPAAKAKQEET